MSRYAEDILSEALGLSRDIVREAREKLLEGEDWETAGNRVVLTDDGVMRLLEALGVDLPKKRARVPGGLTIASLLDLSRLDPLTAVQGEDSAVKGKLYQLEAVSSPRNSKILMARHLEKDAPGETIEGLVRVQVRDNSNFVDGMILVAMWIEQDLWELVGRCPRFRGRW